jgi:hypothetical protein
MKYNKLVYNFLLINICLNQLLIVVFGLSTYKAGMNPGIMIRLEQRTINSFKNAMEQFLPYYLNFDINLPHEYHYKFALFYNLI